MNRSWNLLSDLKAATVMFCSTFGIGSLSMAYIFAEAGMIYGLLILFFIAGCNIYSSIILSKTLLRAPCHVVTLGDLANHLSGEVAQVLVNGVLGASCLLVPVAYLILVGNDLLPFLFKTVAPEISSIEWIIIWSICMAPVVFIPTIRETALTNFVGTIAPLYSCTVALVVTFQQVEFRQRESDISAKNILSTFGAISFSYGTACLIPSIHQEHPNPERLPFILKCSLIFISLSYSVIGIVGYLQFGCTAPSDILTEMPDGIWKYTAYIAMLIHVTLAYAVIITPAIYMIERNIFSHSFHQMQLPIRVNNQAQTIIQDFPILKDNQDIPIDHLSMLNNLSTGTINVQKEIQKDHLSTGAINIQEEMEKDHHLSTGTTISQKEIQKDNLPMLNNHKEEMEKDNLPMLNNHKEEMKKNRLLRLNKTLEMQDVSPIVTRTRRFNSMSEQQRFYTKKEKAISLLLRTSIVFAEALFAIAADHSFSGILDLIGATAVMISCIVVPCCLYLLMFHNEISTLVKGFTCFIIGINISWGLYASFTAFDFIILQVGTSIESTNSTNTTIYPFCLPETNLLEQH